jgi:hypothetical protein
MLVWYGARPGGAVRGKAGEAKAGVEGSWRPGKQGQSTVYFGVASPPGLEVAYPTLPQQHPFFSPVFY